MVMSSTIAIELAGVGRILLNQNLGVPAYQRSYAWQEEHVSDLFNDIKTAINDGAQEYFIGSIVTTKNQSKRADVADGQQRLATITILLASIRDWFYENGDKERASTITSDYLHKKQLKTLSLIPKLTLNVNDNEYFANRILLLPDDSKRLSEKPTKPSHNRIDNAANLAREYIQGIASDRQSTEKLTELVEYLTDSVKVIFVKVPDDTNAFMIFETLNDRGLALAITDLLKNHLFGLASNRLSEVQKEWAGMSSTLEGLGDDENINLTYLRHYWSSQHGLVREKDLYDDIKKKINNESKAVSFAIELERNSHIYAAIVNSTDAFWSRYGDTCRQHMEILNLLRMIQIRPLILSILDRFKESEAKKAIKNLVSLSVRFLIYGGLGGGPLEYNNCQAAKVIRDKTVTTSSQLFSQLKNIIPSDTVFQESFEKATVSKTYLARYYLRALEEKARGGTDPELIPNANTEVINLEHILPQTLSSSWPHISTEEHALLHKRLGNLALMKSKINLKAGNDEFKNKVSFYRNSKFKLTKIIANEKKWDKNAIERRQKYLAELAITTWPLK